jgi:hypothetical protein
MAIQLRGPSSSSDRGEGTYGIGPFGVDYRYNYGVSGGTNGVQFQGQLTVFGMAVRVQYQSGFQEGLLESLSGGGKPASDNFQAQIGFGETFGVGKPSSFLTNGINGFAGIGYSTRDGIVESLSASGDVSIPFTDIKGYNLSYSTTKQLTLFPQPEYFGAVPNDGTLKTINAQDVPAEFDKVNAIILDKIWNGAKSGNGTAAARVGRVLFNPPSRNPRRRVKKNPPTALRLFSRA